MSRSMLFRLTLAGMMIVAGGVASAHAGKSEKQPPDLSGQWRLDPSKSEMPQRPGGGGGGWSGRPHVGGRGGGDADRPGGPGGAPGGPMMRLPDLVRIEQGEASVRMEDSTGAAIEEIVTRGDEADTTSLPPDVPRLIGRWKGDHLEVTRDNGRGGKITETYALEDKGRTLVLKTKVEARRTFEFKRVYEKVAAS